MISLHNIDLCIDFRLMRGRVYVMWFVSHVFIWFVLSHFFLAYEELRKSFFDFVAGKSPVRPLLL